jgi:hypothetical protein
LFTIYFKNFDPINVVTGAPDLSIDTYPTPQELLPLRKRLEEIKGQDVIFISRLFNDVTYAEEIFTIDEPQKRSGWLVGPALQKPESESKHCRDLQERIADRMIDAQSCTQDSDCGVVNLRWRFCYEYVNKNVDMTEVLSLSEKYFEECTNKVDPCSAEYEIVNQFMCMKDSDSNGTCGPYKAFFKM